MTTLMWEARAAAQRGDELVAFADVHAPARALVYRTSDRVVVIDPTGTGLPDPPARLLARPVHVWPFEEVARGSTSQHSSAGG